MAVYRCGFSQIRKLFMIRISLKVLMSVTASLLVYEMFVGDESNVPVYLTFLTVLGGLMFFTRRKPEIPMKEGEPGMPPRDEFSL